MSLPPEVVRAAANPKFCIGRYVMVACVGKGGMGEVWRSFDRELGRWVALKFLLKGSDDDRKRFQREAQLTARLSHPNIVGVHDIGEHEGRPFIAMQLIDGHSLAEHDKTPVRRALEIVRDASNAVHFAHQQGLVHRDIKPANLMVDKTGKTYVTDFGLVRPARVESTISQAGTIMGTPAYMSPEQADGARKLDARTDIYSLGATLYTLVTHRLPFMGESPAQTLVKVLTREPAEPRKVRPELPADVENIIFKAMDKEAGRRYRTAAELADDIQRFLDGEPVRAHPPSLSYKLKKQLAKNKGLVAGVAAGVAGLFAIVIMVVSSAASPFDGLKVDAQKAYQAGAWEKAQALAEQALAIRDDGELTSVAKACKSKIKEEREKARLEKEKSDRIASVSRLHEKLKPFEHDIKEARNFFYIKSVNIREKLGAIERAMPRLREVAISADAQGSAEPWILLGMAAYFAGDFGQAEGAFGEAEKLAPDDFTACFYLARMCLERSMQARMSAERKSVGAEASKRLTDQALKYMSKAAKGAEALDQNVAEAYRAFALGSQSEVRTVCKFGLKQFSGVGTEEYWNLQGFLARGQEAVDCYTAALEIRPHYAWAYFMRGNAKLDLDDLKGALDDYTAAIQIYPKYADALLNRSVVFGDGNAVERAIEDLNTVLSFAPKHADALFNRGNAWKRKQEYERAIADYTAALDVNPKMVEALANRGNCKVRKGDLGGGGVDLDAAIGMDPTYPEAYASRAIVRQAKKDLNGAIDDLKKALEVAPPNWVYRERANQHLGELIKERGGN